MTTEQNTGRLSYDYPVRGYCGIGIHTSIQDGIGLRITLITSPFETPAKRAGIENGDILTHYRYSSEEQWRTIPQHQGKSLHILRGAQGSPISLKLLRAHTNAPYEVTVERQEIIEIENFDPAMQPRFLPQTDSKCAIQALPLPSPATPRLATHSPQARR